MPFAERAHVVDPASPKRYVTRKAFASLATLLMLAIVSQFFAGIDVPVKP